MRSTTDNRRRDGVEAWVRACAVDVAALERRRFARQGRSRLPHEGSIICYTGTRTQSSVCGTITKFNEPVTYAPDPLSEPSRGDRMLRGMIEVKLMDKCRDRRGDSGSATYAKKSDSALGVFAVGPAQRPA